MEIKIGSKLAERQISPFMHQVYLFMNDELDPTITLDFSETEWISNQAFLLITSLFKYFNALNIDYDLVFFNEYSKVSNINKNVALQLIQLWDNWEYTKKFKDRSEYLINDKIVRELKKYHNIDLKRTKIYNEFSVKPFVELEYYTEYDDEKISTKINDYLSLEDATKKILEDHKCDHPFIKNTIGQIITRELYENFLDHFRESLFHVDVNWAFMSLSLKGEIKKLNNPQYLLEKNFLEEAIGKSKRFFFNKTKNEYKNFSYLEYTFLDFGEGIPNTIRNNFLKNHSNMNVIMISDSELIRYAFKHYSSRHPIDIKLSKNDQFIPRGLFDVLTIVKRYSGLIIIWSGQGKVVFDFSDDYTYKNAYEDFNTEYDEPLYFPGTMISIYLPAVLNEKLFDYSAIKPSYFAPNYDHLNEKFISIDEIFNFPNKIKDELFNDLFKRLNELCNDNNINQLIYINFRASNLDRRLTKKIIFYLLTNYDFNLRNNIVVLDPPSKDILDEIRNEIVSLTEVIKNFKIHPLPFIYFDNINNDIKLYWLGVYNDEDIIKLNDLLFEDYSIRNYEFNEPSNVVGNINYFDEFGNLKSYLPNRNILINKYNDLVINSQKSTIGEIIRKNGCLLKDDHQNIYYCNGDYYQKEFLNLINLINNEKDCSTASKLLFEKMSVKFNNSKKQKFISITSTSYKILKTFQKLGFVNKDQIKNIATSTEELIINVEFEYILVCDVIATGEKVKQLFDLINHEGGRLICIGVFANTIDYNFNYEFSSYFPEGFIISLYDYSIKKISSANLTKKHYLKEILNREIIRINPFTNIPINLSLKNAFPENILFDSNSDFLNYISETDFSIGYLNFNNLIHPYFFKTEKIFGKSNSSLIIEIFNRLNKKTNLNTKKLIIVYPNNSGIESLNFEFVKNSIFHNQNIPVIILQRYQVDVGWKFPHTSNSLFSNFFKKQILILDDGSCTGDSILQMVNEVSFYDPDEIIVLTIIGRLSDHKREFFSAISELKDNIKLKIYFATVWHVPTYYIENNPMSKEINWLNKAKEIKNIPSIIKKIIKAILDKIEYKKEKNFCYEYDYLPKDRSTGEIPKKDIILVRDEIGKIIGYRFYKENFHYFNIFIKKYLEQKKSIDRYKVIEIFCATIIFEPYLYEKIKRIVPDVALKIKEFTSAIIIGNPNKDFKILSIARLFYNWDKKHFVQLFFIVHGIKEIEEILINAEKRKKLLNFSCETAYSTNYLLFKLFNKFFPIINAPNDNIKLKRFIEISIEENLVEAKYLKYFKIFNSFISTLYHTENFNALLSRLSDDYKEFSDNHHHKNSIFSKVSMLIVDIDATENNSTPPESFYSTCSDVSRFLELILSFINLYEDFFIISLDDEYLHWLRVFHGEMNKLLYDINQDADLIYFRDMLNRFQERYLSSGSIFYKIFTKITTKNIFHIINQIIEDSEHKNDIDLINFFSDELYIEFPTIFIEGIFDQIVNNFRHSDKSEKIKFNFIEDKDFLTIKIKNKINKKYEEGGGNGTKIFDKIKNYPDEMCKYTCNTDGEYYKQTIKFKRV